MRKWLYKDGAPSCAFFHHDPRTRVTRSSSTHVRAESKNAVRKSKNSPTVAAHGTFGYIFELFYSDCKVPMGTFRYFYLEFFSSR